MKKYSLYIIDLDGTMYKGAERIEAAPVFINQIKQAEQDFVFLTNNSTKTPKEVIEHLKQFDIDATADQVYSTSLATAKHVASHGSEPTVYLIGEQGLKQAMLEAGIKVVNSLNEAKIDFVVMGLDRNITYDKFATATLAIRRGAQFISTNGDKALPTEQGLLPGNGSLTSVVATATGIQPIFIGKPEPLMIEMILKDRQVRKEDVLMIGDNYETDILAGLRAGIDTAIVYTGYSTKESIERAEEKPTYQWNSLADAEDLFNA